MRLIDTVTLALKEYINVRDCPKYAILSHRWLNDEITYQEYLEYLEYLNSWDEASVAWVRKTESIQKIRMACNLASGRGQDYIWIDTCCIDKSSSAELSEAINSMFAWYRAAEVCYVYMYDVQPGYNVPEMLEIARTGDLDRISAPGQAAPFHKSEWFTRGWTLQELIVPSKVEFFAHDWSPIGHRSEMALIINKACGVDAYALAPGVDLNWVSVARKMHWASRRTTARDEDLAYCLLGLFDVNMPLMYGEGGVRAFLRLQEEIAKRSNDQSIFAWDHKSDNSISGGPFAATPRAFENTGKFISLSKKSRRHDETIEVANTGTTLILALEENPFPQPDTFTQSEITHATQSTRMSHVRAALDCQFGPRPGIRFITNVAVEKDVSGLRCLILGALSLTEAEEYDTVGWVPTQVTFCTFPVSSGLSLSGTSLRPYHISIQLEKHLTVLDAFPHPTWDQNTASLFVTGRYPTQYRCSEDIVYVLGGMVLICPRNQPRSTRCLCLTFWDPLKATEESPSPGPPWLANITGGATFPEGSFQLRRAESHWQGTRIMVSFSSCSRPSAGQQPNEILAQITDEQRRNGDARLGSHLYEAVMSKDETYLGIHYKCDVRRSKAPWGTSSLRGEGKGAVAAKKTVASGATPKILFKGFFSAR